MAGTSEIAEEVGCTHRTAYTRLNSLDEKGKVNYRKVGNSLVWIPAE
jgi:Mn-dependent DtxR family transcriptional regulator